MERRDFLRIIGGGVIVAAAARGLPAAAQQASPATSPAVSPTAPWSSPALTGNDIRLRALSHAILAPNPHNRQPWMVDLSVADEVTLHCDPTRLLPQTDPFSRQILIGLGCFIESFAIAASQAGRAADIALFPQGFPDDRIDGRPIARMRLGGAAAPDPLFAQMLARRSAKTPYDMARAIPADAIAALTSAPAKPLHAIRVESAPEAVKAMVGFMNRAGLIEVTTPRAWQESVDLMRIGSAEIAANPDGISMGGPVIEGLLAQGRISRAMMADTSSPAFRAGTERYTASIAATPAAIWFATAGNSRPDQIEAGRAWMRIALTATAQGLNLHPMSQVLQEFPEMAEEFARFHQHVGVRQPARVQMLARLGYGPIVNPTPRWAIETRIRAS